MTAIIKDQNSDFTTKYVNYTDSNGNGFLQIVGMEIALLNIVLQQMNMTCFPVDPREVFGRGPVSLRDFAFGMFSKTTYITLGCFVEHSMFEGVIDVTKTYSVVNELWHVPCSIKLPRWSSIFRILSVELWLVLIISIVIVVISTTLVARYSCTSEWQGYKTVTSSFTKAWAAFLGLSVSTMPQAPPLRSLFLAWLCFSLAFNTVIQAFLTTFLIESGYKIPIQNMDELFASGIKLAMDPELISFFDHGDETVASNIQKNLANCPSIEICMGWAKYQKNVSVLFSDVYAKIHYATGNSVGENSELLLCSLKDDAVFHTGRVMLMLHGDPLLRRVNEIIGRVVEAGLYNYWFSQRIHQINLYSQKIAIVQQLDEYYSFNLYHMQPAFYLLLMGWCISVICFMVEVLYNRVLRRNKLNLIIY
jgi:hypothetical protein